MTNPGVKITVTTDVGYCPFCRRTRTLRREERHLGGLVRTNVDCETCHRTLSSTIGPPAPEPVEVAAPPAAGDAVAVPQEATTAELAANAVATAGEEIAIKKERKPAARTGRSNKKKT